MHCQRGTILVDPPLPSGDCTSITSLSLTVQSITVVGYRALPTIPLLNWKYITSKKHTQW